MLSFLFFIVARSTGSTLKRTPLGSSELPTTDPRATKAPSLTVDLSSFVYSRSLSNTWFRSSVTEEPAATKIRCKAQALPCRRSPIFSPEAVNSESCNTSAVVSFPSKAHAFPITFAAASRTPSSSWRMRSLLASSAVGILSLSLAFLPPLAITTASASKVAVCTAATLLPSFPRDPATSSFIKGSTRVLRGISKPNAPIASSRTCRDESANALTKVVWNCGTNARSAGPPLFRTIPSVFKIAIFTSDGLRSPTIRSSGPTIFTTSLPAKYLLDVRAINSPRPDAETSRMLGLPYKIPSE
mmetsp:Transcript_29636/g.43710  ORF Transcript_29636/g.43710 Transcript_29636/m.43710 type:complete len:300 (-) Transcript_29636:1822-2721(-)